MHALSKSELRRLLEAAKASRERDWLMLLVAFYHGLRVSEVTGFTADAVRDGHLTIQRLKGSMKTTQALVKHPNPLWDERTALIEFAKESTRGQPVFAISRQHFWRLMRKYGKAAGIPAHKTHPHALKHTIAMQSIKRAGVENVRQHLGHKSLGSTGAYLRVTDDEANAAVMKAVRASRL